MQKIQSLKSSDLVVGEKESVVGSGETVAKTAMVFMAFKRGKHFVFRYSQELRGFRIQIKDNNENRCGKIFANLVAPFCLFLISEEVLVKIFLEQEAVFLLHLINLPPKEAFQLILALPDQERSTLAAQVNSLKNERSMLIRLLAILAKEEALELIPLLNQFPKNELMRFACLTKYQAIGLKVLLEILPHSTALKISTTFCGADLVLFAKALTKMPKESFLEFVNTILDFERGFSEKSDTEPAKAIMGFYEYCKAKGVTFTGIKKEDHSEEAHVFFCQLTRSGKDPFRMLPFFQILDEMKGCLYDNFKELFTSPKVFDAFSEFLVTFPLEKIQALSFIYSYIFLNAAYQNFFLIKFLKKHQGSKDALQFIEQYSQGSKIPTYEELETICVSDLAITMEKIPV